METNPWKKEGIYNHVYLERNDFSRPFESVRGYILLRNTTTITEDFTNLYNLGQLFLIKNIWAQFLENT